SLVPHESAQQRAPAAQDQKVPAIRRVLPQEQRQDVVTRREQRNKPADRAAFTGGVSGCDSVKKPGAAAPAGSENNLRQLGGPLGHQDEQSRQRYEQRQVMQKEAAPAE